MNKQQHIFIWIGIAVLTYMAIIFESKFIWVISAITLIGESVLLCKSKKLSTINVMMLILAIIVFVVIFFYSSQPTIYPSLARPIR